MGRRGRPPYPDILTPREWEVLDLLREGLTNEAIAARLGVTHAAAKYHVSEILSKLGVATREQAAAWEPGAAAEATAEAGKPRLRRWWAGVAGWLRPVTLGKTALITASVAVLAGLGVLAWGVWRESGDGGGAVVVASPTATRPPTPTDPAARFLSPTPRPTPNGVASLLGTVLFPVDAMSSDFDYYIVDLQTGEMLGAERLSVWRGRGWSPDGTRVLTFDADGLDIVDVATGEATRLISGALVEASWSPDGSRLAFADRVERYAGNRLYVINADGSGLMRLTDLEGTAGAAWSNDGNYLAFEANGPQRLHVLSLATGEVKAMGTGRNWYAWSPVGAVVAYANEDGVHLYDASTNSSRTLVTGAAGGEILWSPDGLHMLTQYGEPIKYEGPPSGQVTPWALFTVGGPSASVGLGPMLYPDWSADGTSIVYEDYGCLTGEWDIYRVRLEHPSSPVRLTATPDEFKEGVGWVPGSPSRAVAFATRDRLYSLDTVSGTVETMVNYDHRPETNHLHFDGSWSPDGRHVVVQAWGGHGICT